MRRFSSCASWYGQHWRTLLLRSSTVGQLSHVQVEWILELEAIAPYKMIILWSINRHGVATKRYGCATSMHIMPESLDGMYPLRSGKRLAPSGYISSMSLIICAFCMSPSTSVVACTLHAAEPQATGLSSLLLGSKRVGLGGGQGLAAGTAKLRLYGHKEK